jgi:hypothetical protein
VCKIWKTVRQLYKKRSKPSGLASEGSPRPFVRREGREISETRILYTNACSLSNKWPEMSIAANDFGIIAVTETWLNSTQPIEALIPKNFFIYRVDREDGRIGGGVLILVRELIRHKESISLALPNIQFSSCVLLAEGGEWLVACVYRSPSSTEEEDDRLLVELSSACRFHGKILIVGDFNAPEIDWVTETAPPSSFGERLLISHYELALTQHVRVPTRARGEQAPSILDLVFTKGPNDINKLNLAAPWGKSDHATLSINLCIAAPTLPTKVRRFIRGLEDPALTSVAAEMNWGTNNTTVEELWTVIKSNLNQLLDRFAPLKRIRVRGRPPWCRAKVIKAKKRKGKAWKCYLLTSSHREWLGYRKARKKYQTVLRQCRDKYEESLAMRAKTNPKAFYNYVQSKSALRKTVGEVIDENGCPAITNVEKANVLLKHFESVHIPDSGKTPKLQGALLNPTCEVMCEIHVTRDEVVEQLSQLKNGKAPGPDGIPPELLKPLASLLADPLSRLFNLSLTQALLPADWKIATVVPLHKGGSKIVSSNYRPISLTSVILKVLERIIRNKMAHHLATNNLVSANQHGFTKKRSCTSNLLCFMDEITRRIDRSERVEVCYLDFQKAFDTVNHRLLLLKVQAYGVSPGILNWLKVFLTGRSFVVELDGGRSASGMVFSGVPQGSVLGPILFLIYINDLSHALNCPHYMFADDVKIIGDPCQQALQEDLTKVYHWTVDWELPLNVSKCLLLGSEGDRTLPLTLGMDTISTSVTRVSEVRDLGIKITNDFKPSRQCAEATRSGHWALTRLKRTVSSRKPSVLLPLYKTFVRPHLEYAVQAWAPYLKKDILAIERVQRRFTRLFPNLRERDYETRLYELQLFSMERRRLRGDLIEAYKILKVSRTREVIYWRGT